LRAFGQQECSKNEILKFANVARPGIAFKPVQRRGIELPLRLAETRAADLDKVYCKQGDITAPYPQRRQLQMHQLETIQQVETEFAGLGLLIQTAVAGGDDAHICLLFGAAAEGPELVILNEAQ